MNKLEALATYISYVDPRAVNRLAYKWGYPAPGNAQERMKFLFSGIEEEGDSFLKDMALNHPDRELIMNADGNLLHIRNDNPNREPNVIRLNADGEQAVASPIGNQTNQMIKDSSMTKSDIYRLIVILLSLFILYKIFR